MKITILLAGLRFRFFSEIDLDIDTGLKNFIISEKEEADVTIWIKRNWENILLPDSPQLGEDKICRYYRQGDRLYCITRGSFKGPVACSIYGTDYRKILCVLNEKPFMDPPKNLGSILRMIPIRAIFQKFGVLFLHASRICYKDKAILFSAASGIGKTTQARLWHTFRDAEILCNDRTLLRKINDTWYTFGYPLDGSEPVYSNAVIPLGAVIMLAQGQKNHVESLNPSRAASLLMSQLVIDIWNPDAHKTALERVLSLAEEAPIWEQICTPDVQAVETLEGNLRREGVI